MPECVDHVPELYLQRKERLGLHLEKIQGRLPLARKNGSTLESEALDEKYEIFSGKGQDANWLRQLFSPTFIVWLTESAPEKFAFELVDGTLVAYVRGHKEDTADLDQVAAATAVGRKTPARRESPSAADRLRDRSSGWRRGMVDGGLKSPVPGVSEATRAGCGRLRDARAEDLRRPGGTSAGGRPSVAMLRTYPYMGRETANALRARRVAAARRS